MLTPASFLTAISEGSDPTAPTRRHRPPDQGPADQDLRLQQPELHARRTAQVKAAKAAGIPVTTVTETLTPAGASFQQWQTAQLGSGAALAKAAGK